MEREIKKTFRTWKLARCGWGGKRRNGREDMKRSGFEYVDKLIFVHVEFRIPVGYQVPDLFVVMGFLFQATDKEFIQRIHMTEKKGKL